MVKKHPKVSVIMPIYNTKPDYLRQAIDSTLAQIFLDFELLLCDDCSEPYIQEIVDSYKDSRIIYVRNHKNLGVASSRNRLIDMARGEYLALLDSDDTMSNDRLAKQVDFLDKHTEIGCLGTWASVNKGALLFNNKFDPQSLEEHLVFTGCAICNSSVMLRKSVLNKNHIRYKTEFIPAEDYALYCDLVGLTKFAVLPEILCDYKFYNENISCQQTKKQKYKEALAKYNLIERYTGISLAGKDDMANFASLTLPKNTQILFDAISSNMAKLNAYCPEKAEKFFISLQNAYRLMCYKTRSFSTQLQLLFSPMRKFFNQSFGWQLFCFITRGLFNFNQTGEK